MDEADAERLLNVRQAADRLGCGTTTVWSLIRERTLPAVRVKGAIRVSSAAIENFKKQNPY